MGLLGDYMPQWLPEDPDKQAAMRQGLLQFGAAMLQGRGNFGNAFGGGLAAGANGYGAARADQSKQQLQGAQMKQFGLESQKLEGELGKPKRLADILASQGAVGSGLPAVSPAGGAGGAGASVPQTQSLFNTYLSYGDKLSQAGETEAAKQYYLLAEKLQPKLKEQSARTVDGKRVMVNVYDDGATSQVEGFAPDMEKLSFQNTGGTTQALDPFTGKPVNTIANTQSPDSVASGRVAMRGQNMTDARSREANAISGGNGKAPAGYRWTQNGDLEPITGGPAEKLPESQQKQLVGVNNLNGAITEYRDQLATFGTLDITRPDARAAMGTKYNNMMLQAKEAYNLGVLNGPDLEILTSVITDPRSIKGFMTSKKALDAQASELSRIMSKVGGVSSQSRQPQSKPAIQPGVVQGGYVFKGGNPADKNNWVKQ